MTCIGNCPWCEGDETTVLDIEGANRGDDPDWYVECGTCYAQGPMCASRELAIDRWNKLAGLDVAVGRLRWVEWSGGREEHLYCGAMQVGSIWPVPPGKWAGRLRFSDASTIPPRTKDAARAALVDAVKAAFGGGG